MRQTDLACFVIYYPPYTPLIRTEGGLKMEEKTGEKGARAKSEHSQGIISRAPADSRASSDVSLTHLPL